MNLTEYIKQKIRKIADLFDFTIKKLQKQPLCFLMTKIMIIILFVKILAKNLEKTIEII